MMMTREQIFGRLIAIATVLGDRVADKGTPSIADKYLGKLSRDPAKTIGLLHHDLMQHAHKFGPEETALLDMFGELIAQLDIDQFSNDPLKPEYLHSYYSQKNDLFVGLAEAAEILEWSKQQIHVYMQRERFPEPIQRLASGPIWLKQQIITFKNSRK